jgi:hypothetical protein
MSKVRFSAAAVLLIQLLFFISIGYAQPARLTIQSLMNAAYRIGGEPVILKQGKFAKGDSPLKEDFLRVEFKQAVFGDLDNNGSKDAAVIYAYSGGGSGYFYVLSAVKNNQGAPQEAASEMLGDRVIIKSLAIKSGVIVVNLITQGPRDSMANPSLKKTMKYKLAGNKLAQVR